MSAIKERIMGAVAVMNDKRLVLRGEAALMRL